MISDRCKDIVYNHVGDMLIDLKQLDYKLDNIVVKMDGLQENFNFRVNISFIGRKKDV